MIKDTAKPRLRVLIFLLLFVLSEGIFGWIKLLADTVTMALDCIILPDALEEGKGKPFKNWWRWAKNNRNNVCHGALAVASMVFYDYYPELAADFIADAYSRFSYTFDNMGPDGVYAEGSGYWDYNIDYLWYFISAGENVMGTDFGLKTAGSGCLSAGEFPLCITGAQGTFNYGDNKSDSISSAALYWFSRQNGIGVLSKFRNIAMDRVSSRGRGSSQLALSALFATDEYDGAEWDMPLSAHLRSAAGEDLAVMRDGYFDPNGTYAAIKGGYNYTNHGDLDIGTFVFDSMG